MPKGTESWNIIALDYTVQCDPVGKLHIISFLCEDKPVSSSWIFDRIPTFKSNRAVLLSRSNFPH